MTRRTLGLLATVVGSAMGAWWLTAQRRSRPSSRMPARDRGTVIFDNTPAVRAYEKVGFRPVGVMRRYWRSPDGEWRDALLMELLADELDHVDEGSR